MLSSRGVVLLVFATWLVANVTINLYNTYVLSKTNFKFAILLTATNKAIGWCGSLILMLLGPRCKADAKPFPPRHVLLSQLIRPMVIMHGVLTAVNIGFNNWSLVFISLSLNQLLKSVCPLPTAILSVVFEKKSFSWVVWASMTTVIVGTALAAIGNVTFNWWGALLCLTSVLASAGWTVCSAILLQQGADRMNAVDLVFYSSPWSICLLSVLFVSIELGRLLDWVSDPTEESSPGGMICAVIVLGGLLGFGYDLIHNQFVKLTSSLTMAVMGNTKLIILIIISMISFEDHKELNGVFVMNISGAVIGVLGCIWYSWSKLHEKRPPPPLSEALQTSRTKTESSKLIQGATANPICCIVC